MELAKGTVGEPSPVGDGTEKSLRLGTDKSLICAQAHGRYYESTSRGMTFSGMTAVAGTAVVAANVSPVAAAAATILSLYNPLGSGVNLEVLKSWLNFISGTAPAGAFVYNMAFNQNLTAAGNNAGVAGGVPQPNYVSGKKGEGTIYTQTALTGGVGAQVLFKPTGASLFAAVLAATTPVLNFIDDINGDIVIPPGGLLSIAAPAVGAALVVAAGFEWQEIQIQG